MHSGKILRNSILLISEQLFLNIISIFAVGYIARSLGQVNYGKFIFSFSFIALFSPLTNLGVSSVITREITERLHDVRLILGKMLIFKFITSFCAFGLLFLVISIMNYPADTKLIVS